MKILKNVMLLVSGLLITIGIHSYALGIDFNENLKIPKLYPGSNESVAVEGIVQYKNLEGGFYLINNYRLQGNYDFSQYLGKNVIVSGPVDNNPNIYQTGPAITVKSIIEVNDSTVVKIPPTEKKPIINLPPIDNTKPPENSSPKILRLTGTLKYDNLETGFYTLNGYRLSGNFDFSKYLNKQITIEGTFDDSISIYMTKTLRVQNIEVVDYAKTEYRNIPEQIKYVDETVNSYLQNYGTLSEDVKELIKNLENNQRILEEKIKESGKNIDLDIYKNLGAYLKELKKDKELNIFVNGNRPNFEVSPIIEDGRTLIPIREITEALGAKVLWDGKLYKVTVEKDNKTIEFFLKTGVAKVNGNVVPIDVPAKLVNNKTMIPLRFVSEHLNSNVEWIDEGKIVIINDK